MYPRGWMMPALLAGVLVVFTGFDARAQERHPKTWEEYLVRTDEGKPAGLTAQIEVRVRPDVELWFDGVPMGQMGSVRRFESPPPEPGRDYAYEMRVYWTLQGREFSETRPMEVRSGHRYVLDLTPLTYTRRERSAGSEKQEPDRPARRGLEAGVAGKA